MSVEKMPMEAKDGDVDSPHSAEARSHLTIDPVAEKKLLRKLDFWLAPMMIICFLVAYLDRSNIGMSPSTALSRSRLLTSWLQAMPQLQA